MTHSGQAQKETGKRPNTNVPNEYFDAADWILCAGEDKDEMRSALRIVYPKGCLGHHEYRCYGFWRYDDFTLVWTGIGTGSLEPLMWEVLTTGRIRRFVLVGTAGALPRSKAKLGSVYAIDRAYSAATALDHNIQRPLRPAMDIPTTLQRSSSVSTDAYYGFSKLSLEKEKDGQNPPDRPHYPADRRLRKALKAHFSKNALVEMEVAQFYHFCQRFPPSSHRQYLALKVPVNPVDSFEQQTQNTAIALQRVFEAALRVLGIEPTS